MSNEINNLHNESTEKIVNDSPQKHWKKIIPEADKVAPEVNPPVNPNPAPGRNRYLKPLAIGAGAAAAVGGGAYLYNRYQKKKREEAEKTAGLLDDLMKAKNPLGLAAKKRAVNPLRDAARKAQFEALSNMRVNSLGKKAFLDFAEMEKTAATKEEKAEMRRMVGMSKRKIKKRKPNKMKESTYRMKKQKKHAAYDDVELEKMASLMADQFIAASALTSVDPENMNLEEEIIAGYKSYLDEVSNQ